jgi:phosphohistidine phosphatase SixA
MRHALAPGFSDPEGFVLDFCQTQRNLDEKGRQQSREIGDLIRSNGIKRGLIYSSQWCRCLETAELLGVGPVEVLPALNSFFEQPERTNLQTEYVKQWIKNAPLQVPTVMVSHQVNIFQLTGYSPNSGELIFIKRGPDNTVIVVGTIQTLN